MEGESWTGFDAKTSTGQQLAARRIRVDLMRFVSLEM